MDKPINKKLLAARMTVFCNKARAELLEKEKYCTEIFVDAPMNTLLKDQSLRTGLGTGKVRGIGEVYHKTKADLAREQVLSPGVRLVAAQILKRG